MPPFVVGQRTSWLPPGLPHALPSSKERAKDPRAPMKIRFGCTHLRFEKWPHRTMRNDGNPRLAGRWAHQPAVPAINN